MTQIPKYREEVDKILVELEGEENTKPEKDSEIPPAQDIREPDAPQPEEKIYDVWTVPFGNGKVGVLNVRADDNEIVYDSTLVEADTEIPQGPIIQTTLEEEILAAQRGEKTSRQAGLLTMSFFIFLCLACLAVQIHFIISPPVATITIIPKSQTVTLSASLLIGRILNPITLSQSATTPTTGRGHQDARSAAGLVTFYNGSFTPQTIIAGTVYTGADGVQIATDQAVTIPAASPGSPPQFGQASVSAHAINTGASGNVQAGDISITTSTLQVRNSQFSGGQDARDFQTVAKGDIDLTASHLKDTINQSMQGALAGELKSGEMLVSPTCTNSVTSNHQPGAEAATVQVTAAQTCSAIAYNENTLQQQATQLLTQKALQTLGSGYSLFGTIQVTVNHALLTHTTPTLVLSLTGTWAYAISDTEQQRIKRLITGRTYQDALRILHSLPGIENVSIAWDENTKLPKDPKYIHLILITGV